MMSVARQDLFQVGIVVGTHGLRGDVRVRPLTSGSTSLLETKSVSLRRAGGQAYETCQLTRASMHKGLILLRFEGMDSIDAVASLKGAEVYMPLADLPEPAADESYWYELQGAEVIDRRLGSIGRLENLFSTPGHDVYVVQGRFGEVLMPAVDAFILEFDAENACLHVDLPLGLVAEDEDSAQR